jgi:adenosylmethionine-8-amino-7-oxononanoate aminotransferase
MAELAAPLAQHAHVAQVRQTGMILAFELGERDGTPLPAARRTGLRAYRAALRRGVLLRPLGDVLYWMPPYCVSDDDLAHLAQVTAAAIEEATGPCV